MRTVFTDAQMRQLEALFDLSDYPPAEARAEVAESSGLSEETVRVGRVASSATSHRRWVTCGKGPLMLVT